MRTDEDLRRWALTNGATVTLADGSTFNASGLRVASARQAKKPEPEPEPAKQQSVVAAPPAQPQIVVQTSHEVAAAMAEVGKALNAISERGPKRKWKFTPERGDDGLIVSVLVEEL